MPLSRHDYTVACICALGVELAPVHATLDETHPSLPTPRGLNSYVLGEIGEHNIVIAVLPEIGTNAAATVATQLLNDFPAIRFGLMVGIGGGVPDLENGIDIRLGDIVVSKPTDTTGGVIQYDLGKETLIGFERTGTLDKPPAVLRAAVQRLVADHERVEIQVPTYLLQTLDKFPKMKEKYTRPRVEDQLFETSFDHHTGKTCAGCDSAHVIDRPRRSSSDPVVHYGTIGSANRVVKNAAERERLKASGHGIICVEMEAAGLMDSFPCLVIRGICDYADSHKNKKWQHYAALTAAAYMKELLSVIPSKEVTKVPSAVAEIFQYDKGLNLFDAPGMAEELFIGRDVEIQQMEKILQPHSNSSNQFRKLLVLGGMGGIGKSQLSITYAKRYHSLYTSVFWLNANSEAALNLSLRRVAYRIFPLETVSTLDDNRMWILVSNWLSEPSNTRWLLIFDNYDDPDQYPQEKYYPSVAQGSIIMTTRVPDRLNGMTVRVQSMDKEEESLRILATRSGRDSVESDSGARRLAQRLDGHPLALATAGAFLRQSAVSCTQYLERYEAKWKITSTTKELPDYPSRTLYTTWNLSLTKISSKTPRAASFLKFLAYLDHRDISVDLLRGDQGTNTPQWFAELLNDEFGFDEVMNTLVEYCLVENHHDRRSYSLHICVHDWTLSGLNAEVDMILYRLALNCVAFHLPATDWDNLSSEKYSPFTPHASRLAHPRFCQAIILHQLSWTEMLQLGRIAELLYRKGQYVVGKLMLEVLLAGKEKALSIEHPSTLGTVNNLGMLYEEQGRLDQAEQMYDRALAGKEKALGTEHLSTLNTVNNLGILYEEQGRLDQAEQMLKRALAGSKKAQGAEHPSTLDTVNNLGILCKEQGRLDQAEQMYDRALAGKEKALGAEHPSTLGTVNNLGILYKDQGRLDQAEQMLKRALAGKEKALGVEHSSTLSTVNNLGILYNEQGRLDQAEQMLKRALAGKEKALGAAHPLTLSTVDNLGTLYNHQGRLEKAEQMYERALAGREKALGREHNSTLMTMVRMGTLFCLRGYLSEAESMYQPAMSTFKHALSPDHILVLGTANNMGNLYSEQGKWFEAKEMYGRALDGMSRTLGRDHYYIYGVVNNRGLLCTERGEFDAAERMYEEARAGFERSLGPDHPHTKMVCYNIDQLRLLKTQVGAAALDNTGAGNGIDRIEADGNEAQLRRNPSGSSTTLATTDPPTTPPTSTPSTSAPIFPASPKPTNTAPVSPCSRDWYTCRNCTQVCWARMELCPIVGHRSVFHFLEEELTFFCLECSGPEYENMADLLVKFCPLSDLAARQRGVKVMERARRKREERVACLPERRERDSDPLRSVLVEVDLSILYLLPLQKLARQKREAWAKLPAAAKGEGSRSADECAGGCGLVRSIRCAVHESNAVLSELSPA